MRISHRSDNYGTRDLGYFWTDGNGYASTRFTIPTDPRSDNVYLIARFDPYYTLPSYYVTFLASSRSDIRVQIGRSYP